MVRPNSQNLPHERGPAAWRHAAAFNGAEHRARVEVMLYGDNIITAQLLEGIGPYQFLNPVAAGRQPPFPIVVLRAVLDADDGGPVALLENNEIAPTDVSTYHGGDLFDEIAALVSLTLGVRCRPGGITRKWGVEDDPLGRPYEYDHRPPTLVMGRRPRIPSLQRTVAITDAAAPLSKYLSLPATQAVAFVRAARMYQRAVWLCDDDPNQAWIWLVGALEVAAVDHRSLKGTPLEVLARSWPEIHGLVQGVASPDRERIAKALAPLVKSTTRFVEFVLHFQPPPPEPRASTALRVDDDLKAVLATIYSYRSRALHDGTPFPSPMSDAPHRIDADKTRLEERPFGLGATSGDAHWRAEELPALLWWFEYLTRGCLLRWLDSLSERS